MKALVEPVITIKYEIAKQILLVLLDKGLISKSEFDIIDNENRRSFCEEK